MSWFDPSFKKVDTYTPEFIHQGNWPTRRGIVTIEKGQVLKAGSVLGKKTATQKCVLCAAKAQDESAIVDGSEKPYAILQVDVDATAKDITAPIYKAGAFLGLDLTVGKGHTIEAIEDDLWLRSIFIEKGED
ncbi:MAG TPA: head decoration protein [Oligoflexus sp.]|uniref:head decoration protein n=1 Tax=Oligoflexus sp. TaxID=1971216 RepID=UPI002D3DED4F|nr:head decoration protein [Oligoflexus sp.]HYX37110.1 head decoration protein [Oligoflexus sp.]